MHLIELIIKQSSLLGKYQIILLNNIQEKKNINLCLENFKNYQNKQCKIEVINVNKNQTINDIYKKIIELTEGEIIVVTEANTYPDNNWLDNLIKSFGDGSVNIVAGEICQVETQNIIKKIFHLLNKFINKDKFKWTGIFDGQIGNVAVRKEFLKQQKSLNVFNINHRETSYYYRILKEIEAEITYNPSARVYQVK